MFFGALSGDPDIDCYSALESLHGLDELPDVWFRYMFWWSSDKVFFAYQDAVYSVAVVRLIVWYI